MGSIVFLQISRKVVNFEISSSDERNTNPLKSNLERKLQLYL